MIGGKSLFIAHVAFYLPSGDNYRYDENNYIPLAEYSFETPGLAPFCTGTIDNLTRVWANGLKVNRCKPCKPIKVYELTEEERKNVAEFAAERFRQWDEYQEKHPEVRP